jgi:hypothetical protein
MNRSVSTLPNSRTGLWHPIHELEEEEEEEEEEERSHH